MGLQTCNFIDMRKLFAIFVLLLGFAASMSAQRDTTLRPEMQRGAIVNEDHSVTFNFRARNAGWVVVRGDFGKYPMTRTDQDNWSVTTPPLPSDFHEYFFIADDVMLPDPSNYYSTQSSGVVYSNFIIPGGLGDLCSVQDVPHGSLVRLWYHSDALGMDRILHVYLPAGYDSSRKRYPVFYLLHGSSQHADAWLQSGRTVQIMDNLIAQGKAEPMIVVIPGGNLQLYSYPGEDTWNLDYRPMGRVFLPKTNNGDWEAAFPEIVKYIDKHFRTRTGRKDRAIAGLSMGGAQSVAISANYPKLFGYMGCFSCFPMGEGEVMENLDAKIAAQTLGRGMRLYYLSCSSHDALYPEVLKFRDRLQQMGVAVHYVEAGSGHDWFTWRQNLVDFAPLLFK